MVLCAALEIRVAVTNDTMPWFASLVKMSGSSASGASLSECHGGEASEQVVFADGAGTLGGLGSDDA